MAARKFKFISPGIYVTEVDESVIAPTPPVMGPVIIGRTRQGPAMRPIKVENYQDYVDYFGHPVSGPEGADSWRNSFSSGPTYAAYAAKAWLNADVSPATIVRVLGEEHNDRLSTDAAKAGWKTTQTTASSADYLSAVGGAWGLWVFDSGSLKGSDNAAALAGTGQTTTGTLAAIWYTQSGTLMQLSGVHRNADADTTGTAVCIKSVDTNNTFKVILNHYGTAASETKTATKEFTFNFDNGSTSGQFIRNVFNTNPVLTNSDVVNNIADQQDKYWLGETFARQVNENTTTSGYSFGVMLPMISGSVNWAHRRNNFVNPKTGWFISQDFGAYGDYSPDSTTTKLFRFVSRDYGTAGHNFKIAIEDIKASPNTVTPYGSFTVSVYDIHMSDKTAKFGALERFTNCNLNPNSPNYIANRIGDKYVSWDYDLDRQYEQGQYINKSKYIRVEMNPALDHDFNPSALPYGVGGPIRPRKAYYESGSQFFTDTWYRHDTLPVELHTLVSGGATAGNTSGSNQLQLAGAAKESHGNYIDVGNHQSTDVGLPFSGTFEFPAPSLRSSSLDGPASGPQDDAYFGISVSKTKNDNIRDEGILDILRGMPFTDSTGGTVFGRFDELSGLPAGTEFPWVFSLDDIRINAANGSGEWVSGSRRGGTSVTAVSSSYKKVLDYHNRFWTCMAGGHDGFDITEAEPLRNSQWTAGTTTKYDSYSWNSVDRAIATVSDQDVVEYNLITAPGITNDDLTNRVLEVAEDRGDALAIIDLADVFKPSTENTNSFSSNLGAVTTVVSNVQARELDTSYGCTYYPWVQIKDARNDALVWVPPSVVALGTFGSSQATSELWFAPAGFMRGGLTHRSRPAGLPVVSVSERLTQKQRDKLYDEQINPIARFPSEGIVIYGQKTLQATQSALDRINVRRLLIYLKKEISRMSTEVLFDQNTSATWNRFKSLVNPFLASVKSRFGLTDYQVILDETTTTPDLIDRNILYAKIFIKPARAIEFIALDFIITKTGASFED